jgi:hypothetical protein
MSKLEDSMFYHQKLKQRMDKLLSRIPEQIPINPQTLRGTLFDRYNSMVPIYRKFINFDRRYFATAVIDLKSIHRKPKQQLASNSTSCTTPFSLTP